MAGRIDLIILQRLGQANDEIEVLLTSPVSLIRFHVSIISLSHNKLRYVHTCAERLRNGDRRILTFPLRYRGYVHTCAERTQADLPFLEDKDGLEHVVSKRTRKIGCWTHWLRRGFCSRSASTPRVNACNVEANFPPTSARVRSAHVWTYLYTLQCWNNNIPG